MSLFVIAVLSILLVACLIRLFLLKRSLKELSQEISAILKNSTNRKIRLSSRDRDLAQLSRTLESQLDSLRSLQRQAVSLQQGFHEELSAFFHDLKTPLSAAIGYLDLATEQHDPLLKGQYVQKARSRLEQMKEMSAQLLDASTSLEQNLPNQELVFLNQLLEEVLLGFSSQIQSLKIRMDCQICDTPLYIETSRTLLVRILENLVSNACRHGSEWISVRLSEEGTIQITNPAPDLDRLDVEKLFERYFSVEKPGPSSGLGLPIARTLSQRMGADLQADLKDGILCMSLHLKELRPKDFALLKKDLPSGSS